MFICEKCRELVDPSSSSDVVRLIRLDTVGRRFDAPATRLEGQGAYFHKRHAPRLGKEWRQPPTGGDDAMAAGAPGEDAPLPLDEP